MFTLFTFKGVLLDHWTKDLQDFRFGYRLWKSQNPVTTAIINHGDRGEIRWHTDLGKFCSDVDRSTLRPIA